MADSYRQLGGSFFDFCKTARPVSKGSVTSAIAWDARVPAVVADNHAGAAADDANVHDEEACNPLKHMLECATPKCAGQAAGIAETARLWHITHCSAQLILQAADRTL